MGRKSDCDRGRGSYCLRCYAGLSERGGVLSTCSECGYANLTADRRIFWTREPNLIEIEMSLKVLLVAGTSLAMLITVVSATASGSGAGWYFAIPLVAAAAFWSTISKVTHHVDYFSARVLWTVVPLVPATLFLVIPSIGFGVTLSASSWSELSFVELWVGITAMWTWVGILCFFAFLLWWTSARLEAWKQQKIHRGKWTGRAGVGRWFRRLLCLWVVSMVVPWIGWTWILSREESALAEEMDRVQREVFSRVPPDGPPREVNNWDPGWRAILDWAPRDTLYQHRFLELEYVPIGRLIERAYLPDLPLILAETDSLEKHVRTILGKPCPSARSDRLHKNLRLARNAMLCRAAESLKRGDEREGLEEIAQVLHSLRGHRHEGAWVFERPLSLVTTHLQTPKSQPALAFLILDPPLRAIDFQADLAAWVTRECSRDLSGFFGRSESTTWARVVSFFSRPADLAGYRWFLSDARHLLALEDDPNSLREELSRLRLSQKRVDLFRKWRPKHFIDRYLIANAGFDLSLAAARTALGALAFREKEGRWPQVSNELSRLFSPGEIPSIPGATIRLEPLDSDRLRVVADDPALPRDGLPAWPRTWLLEGIGH